jgi:DNA-directed RNA polymerase specialized sigma24 family protein
MLSAAEVHWHEQDDPELWLYRDRTVGLLRRYFRYSVELGRLPSLLGREFFRSRVTSYRMHSFEDAVIFVHDVERCLEKLDSFSQQLIARLALQEYTQAEAARLLHCSRRTVVRRYPEALDRLSRIFLKSELLRPMQNLARESRCQDLKARPAAVSHSAAG